MSEKNDRAVIRSMEGRGRRTGILVAAVIAVLIVVWLVARGFHGEKVDSGAKALTDPAAAPARPAN